ncbi:Retrovirus-related Pol polyprotein from transposon TNT 1-94 [Eumeta japonica]|uniref:Retrovirus-related Pol polyprotein from transposon TNT 1-94 n=2 Tax=Eumeta variegata TaxID=151549 RepID=A0A4C1VG43_EUMVA|nr:Retrovirus-related Pol polyprotein from transposon TNT 1-94 [Eumeta japonica]
MDPARSMNLERFDGNNFRQWKFQIKCALKAKGIDISIPKPEINSTEWLKNDGMAMFIITSSMDFKQITLIENCETAKEIMEKLESIYEQKSELCKMLIHEKFYQYKMSENDSVAQHISKVENLAKQLKESGESVSEMAIITKIIGTLPLKYRSIRQAWMSLDPTQQTLNNLTARLLDAESSLASVEEQETALLVVNKGWKNVPKQNGPRSCGSGTSQNKTTKHRFECYNCGKRGNFSKECRFPKQNKPRKHLKESSDMLAFNVEISSYNTEENAWIMDSGASAHMTFRKDFFVELLKCSEKSLTLGNKQSVEVSGIGKVLIKRYVNGQWETSELHGVLRSYKSQADQLRTKLEKKSEKMLLIGYDNTNYRMYDMNKKTIKISRNVIFDEHQVPEVRKNITQICTIDDNEETTIQNNETEVRNMDETLIKTTASESDDSLLSCNNDDPTYEPSQEIEDIMSHRNITLRPRNNRRFEANLVELSLPQTYDEALQSPQKYEWSQAIKEELSAHKENNTWNAVPRAGQRTLTTKWVFTIKKGENNEARYKARLCARGFTQIKDVDYQEIFSPTTRYDSLRIILSIAAKHKLEIQQFDVKTAFLNGHLQENIFIEVPEGVSVSLNKSHVLKLNKSLYGLKQASRCWNKRFTEF